MRWPFMLRSTHDREMSQQEAAERIRTDIAVRRVRAEWFITGIKADTEGLRLELVSRDGLRWMDVRLKDLDPKFPVGLGRVAFPQTLGSLSGVRVVSMARPILEPEARQKALEEILSADPEWPKVMPPPDGRKIEGGRYWDPHKGDADAGK